MNPINPQHYTQIVFFTGAGMSAESGIPTYRGVGGVWKKYNFKEYACEEAFQRDSEKVFEFHTIRRKKIGLCKPHTGYEIISGIQKKHISVSIITQNIDGLHQKSGSENVIELHGSLWRLRCIEEDIVLEASEENNESYSCRCGAKLRPDIIWFGDALNMKIVENAFDLSRQADLFIGIGTSGEVWPAAEIPYYAKENGSRMIEINPEKSMASHLYDDHIRKPSSKALLDLFGYS